MSIVIEKETSGSRFFTESSAEKVAWIGVRSHNEGEEPTTRRCDIFQRFCYGEAVYWTKQETCKLTEALDAKALAAALEEAYQTGRALVPNSSLDDKRTSGKVVTEKMCWDITLVHRVVDEFGDEEGILLRFTFNGNDEDSWVEYWALTDEGWVVDNRFRPLDESVVTSLPKIYERESVVKLLQKSEHTQIEFNTLND